MKNMKKVEILLKSADDGQDDTGRNQDGDTGKTQRRKIFSP